MKVYPWFDFTVGEYLTEVPPSRWNGRYVVWNMRSPLAIAVSDVSFIRRLSPDLPEGLDGASLTCESEYVPLSIFPL